MNPGASVKFYWNGQRTGTFLGVKENVKSTHKDFGMYKIRPNFISRKEMLIRPEEIKPLELVEEVAS